MRFVATVACLLALPAHADEGLLKAYPADQKPPGQRLVLTTEVPAAAEAALACFELQLLGRFVVARAKCKTAIANDPELALAHFWLATATAGDERKKHLADALDKMIKTSSAEKTLLAAQQTVMDGRPATAAFEAVVNALKEDPRAFAARAHYRYRTLGNVEGAISDLKHATELDPKFVPGQALYAEVAVAAGQAEIAKSAADAALNLAPKEAHAHFVSALAAMPKALPAASQHARRAVALDGSYGAAQRLLGDLLVFSGKAGEARAAFAAEQKDATLHHDGAMRTAFTFLHEGRLPEATKALAAEAEAAQKDKRSGDRAEALLVLARIELDRGALSQAGQAVHDAHTAIAASAADKSSRTPDQMPEQQNVTALRLRSMLLAAIFEREAAEGKAEQMRSAMQPLGDPMAVQKTTALRGWIAARNGDDKNALIDLAVAPNPTDRMALALAASRSGDQARAKVIMEELATRQVNDLEGALTRPRAIAWLKTAKLKP